MPTTLSILALSAFTITACVVLFQLAFAAWFVALRARRYGSPDDDAGWPRVAVLLGLRGADPDLAESLRRLVTQDYPDYTVHICVDSAADPAAGVVADVVRGAGGVRVECEVYRDSRDDGLVNCTNSKIVQLARRLDSTVEVIVTVDGDMMPHRCWLRELVAPLVADPRLGATFGNRWFCPAEARLGSLVRYCWNAAAVVYMWLHGMPWGGCLAVRARTVRKLNLLERWSRVVALDACLPHDLARAGQRVVYVPSLLMINCEECRLAFVANFIQRQLTWTRLYHPRWPVIVASTLAVPLGLLAVLALAFLAAATGDGAALAWCAASIAGWWAGMLSLNLLVEIGVRRQLRARGDGLHWLTPTAVLRLPLALLLAQFVQTLAMLRAVFVRRVVWRGLTLEIGGPQSIRAVDSAPSAVPDPAAEPRLSV